MTGRLCAPVDWRVMPVKFFIMGENNMKIVGYIISFVALIVFGVLWSGYALSILWGWFVVPTFHLPALSIPAAIGISMIVSYMTHQRPPEDKDVSSTEKLVKAGIQLTLKPAFALGFGWIVRYWA